MDSLIEASSNGTFTKKEWTQEASCDKHGEYIARCYRFLGNDFIGTCPLCDEELTEKIRKEKIEEQYRREKEAEIIRCRYANIEPAFSHASFDNFEVDTDELKHNLEKMKALISGNIKKIVMTGRNGTGKTHLACAAINAIGGKIMTMYEISTTIRESYTPKGDRSELEIVDDLARLPLFVIDELGRTKGSDTEANWLSYIIDKRHVRGLPTIIISNKHTRKTCSQDGCKDCLENYIGDDIMSRLSEDGVLLKFTGDDYRKPKKGE